jgi:hypothetical protein
VNPQPIATAPKDGTSILAYNCVTGWYKTKYEDGEWPMADWMGSLDRAKNTMWPGIWYPKPSHWLPMLPAPDGDKQEALHNQNTGHGHVRPRPDGVKARCGGPSICSGCARELAEHHWRGVSDAPMDQQTVPPDGMTQ